GKSQNAAEAALSANKLKVGKVTREYSTSVDKNTVISSSPKAGKLLKRDTRVDLVVSNGIPPVTVPKVVGLSRKAAEQKLSDAGLRFAVREEKHKTADEGTVFSQSPEAETEQAKGSTVVITVSMGPPVVQVPDVTRMPIGAATKKLEQAGFTVDSSRVPGGRGRVIQQDPQGQAPYGSTVKLWAF
ncbi:MAG: PASTA domain-containing protein, partial [Actinobacteria bacterium]|nr:PASTA domain-containing protein [Actinomycetota bacterium]